jgi:hypothetical protein
MRASARRHPEGTRQDLTERQDHERLKDMVGPGRHFPFGLPRTDNASYLWMQLFYSASYDKGRAGFVMASSAFDARSSEQEPRRPRSDGELQLIQPDVLQVPPIAHHANVKEITGKLTGADQLRNSMGAPSMWALAP